MAVFLCIKCSQIEVNLWASCCTFPCLCHLSLGVGLTLKGEMLFKKPWWLLVPHSPEEYTFALHSLPRARDKKKSFDSSESIRKANPQSLAFLPFIVSGDAEHLSVYILHPRHCSTTLQRLFAQRKSNLVLKDLGDLCMY